MPKVKTCKTTVKRAEFVSILNVDSSGSFSIKRPGESADWPSGDLTIRGTVAQDVELEWQNSCRDYSERTRKEKRMLMVRFDSTIREGGQRSFFTNGGTQILLECAVVIQVTTVQGEAAKVTYMRPPEFEGVHAPRQPFPSCMVLKEDRWNWNKDDITVVEWTQELQDTLVRACQGIEAIVDMLDGVLTTPEGMLLAASKLKRLNAPAE